jgi:hypothetical protein
MKIKVYDQYGQYHGTFADIDAAREYVARLVNTCAWISGPVYRQA